MEPVRVLSTDQMAMIDDAAQEILEQTGMKIISDEALDYLERFGCKVDRDSYVVKFPRRLVRDVVDKMRKDYRSQSQPARMPVRFSHVRFRAEPHRVHSDFTVSAGGFMCFIYDIEGRRRQANRQDVLCSINMVNQLDQIDLTGLPVSDQAIPSWHRPVAMAAELVKHTRKIGGIETFAKSDVAYITEIATIVAGSEEEFRRNPRLVGYAEVRSPLCFDRNMVEIFLEYVKRGVPQTVDTMPCGGTTAPMTGAGVLALGAAETIAPMVLAYAVRDDAVVGMDITPSFADMSTGIYKYGGAERQNLLMARIQLLSEYYGCPTGVHGGKTDSCFLNEQTGAEKMASMLLTVLAGAVGIGTVGAIENAMTFSPVQLVIDSEIVRFVRRSVCKPFEVNKDTLATDVVSTVGHGGNFLAETHTAERFRDELLLSPLFCTQTWEGAHAHQTQFDTAAKASQMARELWHPPEAPVLSDDQVRAIDAVVRRAAAAGQ
jgi:trimethylamine---corrinoid protein Co-methyltransferase